MRKLILTALIAVVALSAQADLYWYNTVAINDENGDPVTASQSDSSVGYFAQLLFTGADGEADAFVVSGSGISGDDAVIATMFAGQNYFLATDGFFPLQDPPPAVAGSAGNGDYYVRVYNAPNSNFGMGTNAPIPSGATYYWQSAEHTYTHSETLPDSWDFAPSGGQTLTPIAIPEPALLGLAVVGLVSLRLYRRRQA